MSQGPCAVAALAVVVAAAETGTAIAAAIRHTASSRVRRRILVIRDTKPSVFIRFSSVGMARLPWRLIRSPPSATPRRCARDYDLAGLFPAPKQVSFRLIAAQNASIDGG